MEIWSCSENHCRMTILIQLIVFSLTFCFLWWVSKSCPHWRLAFVMSKSAAHRLAVPRRSPFPFPYTVLPNVSKAETMGMQTKLGVQSECLTFEKKQHIGVRMGISMALLVSTLQTRSLVFKFNTTFFPCGDSVIYWIDPLTLDQRVACSIPVNAWHFCPSARHLIHIAALHPGV